MRKRSGCKAISFRIELETFMKCTISQIGQTVEDLAVYFIFFLIMFPSDKAVIETKV